MNSEQQPALNSTLFDVQNTADFQKLKAVEREDFQELEKGISYINEQIFATGIDYEDQMRILGEAIAVTLLASDHKNGYPIDCNGLQTLKTDLQNDFGIDLDEYAEALGFPSGKVMLFSDKMKQYVKPDLNKNGKDVLKGRPFENPLLNELLVDQHLGHNAAEEKANQKIVERKVRLNAARINPEAVEGRLRIYSFVKDLKPPGAWVSYQEVQQEYQKKYGVQLNKTEFKKFFGSGDVFHTLKEIAADDLIVMEDSRQTGSIFMKLRRSFEEIETGYKKLLKDAESLPTLDEITEFKKQNEQEKWVQQKPKKINTDSAPPNFVVDPNSLKSKSALLDEIDNDDLAFSSFGKKQNGVKPSTSSKSESAFAPAQVKTTQQKPVSKQKSTAYTHRGEGQYTDTSEDDDEDVSVAPSQVFKPPPVPERNKENILSQASNVKLPVKQSDPFSKSDDEDNVVLMEKTIAPAKTNVNPSHQVFPQVSTNNAISVDKQLIMKAFVFGFLKSTNPLLCPIGNIVTKAESYMASQNLQISKEEIAMFIYGLRTELAFFSNDAYVTLAKTRK